MTHQKIYTILGATGHIGHLIVEDLLRRGHIVRAVSRDQRKLYQLENRGALPCELDLTDSDALAKACEGADALFTLIPPIFASDNYLAYQDQVGESICSAIKKGNLKRVVNLSSVGADLAEGTGPVAGLHRQEERLNAIQSLDFLIHLRANYFMENLYRFFSMIPEGMIRYPYAADLPIPMVATRDIGWKAVGFLENTLPTLRQFFDFAGPEEITLNDATEAFAKAFECPDLCYEQISFEQEKEILMELGLNSTTADLMVEMEKSFSKGLMKPTQELTREHRGTTNLETFVEMIAYRSLAKAA